MIFNLFNSSENNKKNASMDNLVKAQIVIETITDSIAIVDRNGIIQLFNPAAVSLTGWSSDSAVNLDYRSIFSLLNSAEHKLDESEDPIKQAFVTKEQQRSDNVYIVTASKKKIQISIKVIPILEKNGNPESVINGVVIVFRDITRERAEQNAQTDFISTASHEMRTPVATIEGYIGMILNPNICTIDDRARDYAVKSHKAITHLGHLFQDLLDVTKADDSRLNLHPVLINAITATDQIVDNFKRLASNKGLSLEFNGKTYVGEPGSDSDPMDDRGVGVVSPPSIIYADLDRLNEVLSNMIENAIKYTNKGSVEVRVYNNQKRVHIEVKDSGIGIPSEDLPHLFQKFYRVDNSQTREIGGTGLGLYLIKKLTTSMGGRVGVDSEYGQGSTFWIEFDNLNREEMIQKALEIKNRENRSG